jgi:glucose-6-phosphate 1-dehydrogenase
MTGSRTSHAWPGPGMRLATQRLQFSLHEDQAHLELCEAYERLIDDAMVGDRGLCADAREIERPWEVSERLLEHPPEVHLYPQES